MGRLTVAASIAALLSFAGSASAADLYGGGLKDTPAYVPVNSWSGFYFGANGGYGWDAAGAKTIDVDLGPVGGLQIRNLPLGRTAEQDGGFGGAQTGYNWQHDHFVFGIETDVQISDINGTKSFSIVPGFSVTDKAEIDYFGTVRGRIGYAWDNTLIYFTGGFAYGKVNDEAVGRILNVLEIGRASKSEIQTGYVLGGGVEFKPSWGFLSGPNWSVKAEYQYINLGNEDLKGTAILGLIPVTARTGDTEFHTFRVGLNYHIPNGYEPLK